MVPASAADANNADTTTTFFGPGSSFSSQRPRALQQHAPDAAALCPAAAGTDAAATPTDGARRALQGEEDGGQEGAFILELDDFGDQALLEALVEKVLRGEQALDTADGVPVRALVCSAATAAGSMEAVNDDESPAVVVPDSSGSDAATDDASAGDGGDGGGSSTPSDDSSGSSSSSSSKPKARTTKRPRAVSAPVAGGIAAAVVGTLLFALLVGLRGQLRRQRRRSVGMKVSQAGANTVLPVPAGADSPPPPPSY